MVSYNGLPAFPGPSACYFEHGRVCLCAFSGKWEANGQEMRAEEWNASLLSSGCPLEEE